MLKKGMKAPEFTLCDQRGKEISLSDFHGKKVVIYFYSKDSTPGCTRQTCAYNSLYDQFSEKGTVILGISKDTVSSHQKFAEKYDLKFHILSDPDKKVLEMYDILKEKTMYGKKVMGVVRSSFVIDENGIILEVQTKVKPDTNAQDVLDIL